MHNNDVKVDEKVAKPVPQRMEYHEETSTLSADKKKQEENMKIVQENKEKSKQFKTKKQLEDEEFQREKERKKREAEEKKVRDLELMKRNAQIAKGQVPNPHIKQDTTLPNLPEPDEETKRALTEKAKHNELQLLEESKIENDRKAQFNEANKQKFEVHEEYTPNRKPIVTGAGVNDKKKTFANS